LPRTFSEPGIRIQGAGIRERKPDDRVRKGEQEAGIRGETIRGNLDRESFDPLGADSDEADDLSRRRNASDSDGPTAMKRTSDLESVGHILKRLNTGSLK